MPNPGVQSQFIARSGSNLFQGEYHLDWYNNALQGSNIPDEYSVPTAFNHSPIGAHSNEIDRYYDHDVNAGGPIRRDRAWIFGTYREQFNAVAQPNFQFDKTFDTTLWNAVVKATYQLNPQHKLIGYYQWGQKEQPNRLPFAAYTYRSPEQTFSQDSGSWVYKAEWNGTISDQLYVEARYGDFGYYFPLITNSSDNFFWQDSGALISQGAHQKQQLDRDRKQFTGAATYFLDTGTGSHALKFGGELLKEQAWEGFESRRGGTSGIEQIYNNGVSTQVVFGLRTAACEVGGLGGHDCLTARAALDQAGVFLNDTWSFNRLTVNAGVRYDRYRGWLPEQQQLAATTGPVSVPAKTFAEVDQYTWNVAAPRVGVVYDLSGDGATVVKANYGLYWHNPGVQLGGAGNPNTANKFQTHAWNDLNRDQRWQPGEEGIIQTSSLEGNITVDPKVKAPYTHEASAWIERQLTGTMGLRGGFVYKTEDDLFSTMQPFRGAPPFADAYTVPFTFVDIGVDGIRGTADDTNLTLLGMPTAQAAQFPATQVVTTTPEFSRYKTVEVSLNKRYSGRWSASMGGAYTWLHDFPQGDYPLNPNLPYDDERTIWSVKASGSYDAPYGIRISPVLRHQSGANFGRSFTVSAPAVTGLTASGTAFAEPANANREDNIWVFDVRVEKSLNLTRRIRLRAYLDAFNIANSHASETTARATGPQYRKPTAILAPFTTRVGFRVLF
jgi:hypothetical protein